MQLQVGKRGGRTPRVRPEFSVVGDDRIIGSTVWLDDEGRRIERFQVLTISGFQVLTISDGKIADLQGCETRREAERFARRRR